MSGEKAVIKVRQISTYRMGSKRHRKANETLRGEERIPVNATYDTEQHWFCCGNCASAWIKPAWIIAAYGVLIVKPSAAGTRETRVATATENFMAGIERR
jgi:hypothetical protein